MDEMARILLVWQVRLQCRAGLAAHVDMKRALRAHRYYPFWFAAQSFLVATANVSKALWGDGGKRAVERAEIREALEIDDSSCLRPRKMRNHWEHFDERIEEWFQSGRNYPRDCHIDPHWRGPRVVPPIEGFRTYDHAAGELVFWGDRYPVAEIAHALTLLNRNAKAFLGV